LKRVVFSIFVLIAALFIGQHASDIVPKLRFSDRISYPALAGALVFQGLFWLLLSHAWVAVLREFSRVNISLRNSFRQQALVSVGKYLPGKIWGMVARGGQLRKAGMEVTAVAEITYLDQLFLLHSGLALTGIFALLLYESWQIRMLSLAAIVSVPMLAYWHGQFFKGVDYLLRRHMNVNLSGTIRNITMLSYCRSIVRYLLVWLSSGIIFALIHYAFIDQSMSGTLLGALILANTIGIWAGFIAIFAPGGIGVREAAGIVVLQSFMPLESAVMLSILSRAWLILMDLLGGAAGYFLPDPGPGA
jgi:glycosyltransferase 2 family protein